MASSAERKGHNVMVKKTNDSSSNDKGTMVLAVLLVFEGRSIHSSGDRPKQMQNEGGR